ncbi:MAG: hypothetical protein IKB86_07315 [Clostridia bacterium]|nr:hypothetical protein [Clostridia bacterium]
MKKFITLLLAIALIFSMAIATVSAEAAPKNYFDMETAATKTVGSGKIAVEEVDGEKVYAFTNLEYRWDSGAIDIHPAVQEAIGDEEYVELTLVFKIKTVFTTDFEGHKTSCIASLRCLTAPDKALGDDEWNSQYEDDIEGCEALFEKFNGNLQYNLSTKRVPINDEDWTEYTVDMYFEKAVVDSEMTPDWSLCLDQTNGAHQPTSTEAPKGKLVMFDKILIKDVGVYQTEEWLAANPPEDAATPTLTPDTDAPADDEGEGDTVEPTATPTVKPTATSKPVATATPDTNEPADDDNQDDSNLTWLWIAIAAVVVAGAAVAVVVILKKKKATANEDSADEKTEK